MVSTTPWRGKTCHWLCKRSSLTGKNPHNITGSLCQVEVCVCEWVCYVYLCVCVCVLCVLCVCVLCVCVCVCCVYLCACVRVCRTVGSSCRSRDNTYSFIHHLQPSAMKLVSSCMEKEPSSAWAWAILC